MVHNVQSHQKYIELKVSPNTKYTVIVPIYNNHVYAIYDSIGQKAIVPYRLASMRNVFNFTSDNDTDFRLYCRMFDEQGNLLQSGELNENALNIIILEGDHTDKDITFFEGLKSVGQDTDEISVLSVNENLINLKDYTNTYSGVTIDIKDNIVTLNGKSTNNIRFKFTNEYDITTGDFGKSSWLNEKVDFVAKGTTYCTKLTQFSGTKTSGDVVHSFRDNTHASIVSPSKSPAIPSVDLAYGMVFIGNNITFNNYSFGISLIKGSEMKSYKKPKQNKKQVLYYNPTTQTWEKPVLREWDSIEKHSNGKYYYHKRSEEVVLNGSERSEVQPDFTNQVNTIGFRIPNIVNGNTRIGTDIGICSHFNVVNQNILHISDVEAITQGYNSIYFRINRTKLPTQDVEGFKAWLQANNVTVVYQLAQEEVYECTNLDLITYSGETNLIVNSGAIQPKVTLKVLSNVSNVVKLLQEKVSILENKFIKGLQQVLAGDMMSLAHLLYPEDFTLENDTPQVIPCIEEGDINE
jgi:hypothetical protein